MKEFYDVILVYPNFTSKSYHPPLGLAHIAASLLRDGISVKIIDCSFLESIEELKKELSEMEARIVGLSFMSSMKEDAYMVAKVIKNILPKSLLIAGGPHPTVYKEECIKEKNIDAIVIGEGEEVMVELYRQYSKDKKLNGIKGVYYKKNNNIIKNELREPILDLNMFPIPAYHLLPKKYFGVRFSIITSRGCPFQCSYCQPTQRLIYGARVKYDSSARVIEKINKIVDNSKVSSIIFEDDTFTIDENRVIKICDLIIANGLNKKIQFRCHVRARPFPKLETLEKMRKANFTSVSVGFESGSDKILKELNKGTTAKDNINAGVTLKKMGFTVFAYIMIGAPSEDKKTLADTWQMVKKINPLEVRVSIVTPLPGTQLESYCRELNILNEKITDKEKFHYDSFEELPIKISLDKQYLLKIKYKIENYIRLRRIIIKIISNPSELINYFKILVSRIYTLTFKKL